MLKERIEFIRNTLYTIDLFIVTVCFVAVYYIFGYGHHFYHLDLIPNANVIPTPESPDLYLRGYLLALVIWGVVLKTRDPYHVRLQTHAKIFGHLLADGVIFIGFFTSACFLFKFDFISRAFIFLYTGVTLLIMLGLRFTVLATAYYVRRKGHNYRNLLVVGTGKRAQDFLKLTEKHKEWGFKIFGLLDHAAELIGKEVKGYKVMGTLSDLPEILQRNVIDEVVFIVPRNWLKEIEKSILYCEAVGVPATLSTDFFDLEIASGVPKEMDGFTYLTFETSRLRDPELLIKRTLDIIVSSIFLILMSPVFALVALGVKLSSKGPVFFSQVRCGRNGREFTLYKFRSMIPNAEAKLEELKKFNEMQGPVFKMTNDPRLTKIGRFLRKTSLDEFPQFWNVFKGDMSVVGPRPPLPSEVKKYEPWQRRRLSMKPGITCIWQVSGRNEINFEDWMKLDLQYIDRWSLWLDIKIIFLTFKAVLSSKGAK